jgi:hypothetical protein
MWATPKAGDAIIGATARTSDRPLEKTTHLAAQVHLCPTPTASDSQGTTCGKAPEGSVRLKEYARLYPTPRASDGEHGGPKQKDSKGNPALSAIAAMLPTPTVNDAKNNAALSQAERNSKALNVVAGGSLNPDWVEWLVGVPLGWTEIGGETSPISRESQKVSLTEFHA